MALAKKGKKMKCLYTKASLITAVTGAALATLSFSALAGDVSSTGAAASEAPVPSVEVLGSREDRDEKSYRNIVSGMDVFEKNRSLAPAASLRFKILERKAGVSLNGLTLQIVGDHTKIPVPIDKDQVFDLARNADAASDRAVLTSNRKSGSLTWRAEIRSPGVPANARRLGDLLLECKVGLASGLIAYLHHPVNMLIVGLPDPCRDVAINMFYFADRPLFSVTLIDGKRRSVLPAAMLHGPEIPYLLAITQDWPFLKDRVFMVKFKSLYEKGWTDDTLLQFDYMDDDTASEKQAALPPIANK